MGLGGIFDIGIGHIQLNNFGETSVVGIQGGRDFPEPEAFRRTGRSIYVCRGTESKEVGDFKLGRSCYAFLVC